MIAIAAVDENWALGYRNRLLCSIPEDMAFFTETTRGHRVVCGRKTLESFPGGRPLKDRQTIILTRNPQYRVEGADIVHSTDELFALLRGVNQDEVFVIGGGEIYKLLLPYCNRCLITKIHHAFQADAWFPDLEKDGAWHIAGRSGLREYEGLKYEFLTWERR